jgi:8-oxo-dGTP pyrophosphatase MutT (NUDIX family)
VTTNKQAWQTLRSELKYENPWFRVEEHSVIDPSGAPAVYGTVNFKNRAVAVLALDPDEHIFLVGQHRYTLNDYSWELPMGGAPAEETLLAAAQRELREETGISAKQWREVMRLHTSNCVTDELGIVFLATELTFGEAAPEPTEDLDVLRLPLVDAIDWAMTGRITDAISVAGILRLYADRPSASHGSSD